MLSTSARYDAATILPDTPTVFHTAEPSLYSISTRVMAAVAAWAFRMRTL